MKILKRILIALAVIIAIPLIIAIFLPKSYTVERSVTVNAPKAEVFDYVKYLRNHNKFSVWSTMDPEMKSSYRGTDGQAGFVSAWESEDKNVGKGEQEIKKIAEGERIDYELRFMEPFAGTSEAYMTTEATGVQQTEVKWGFVGHMPYPTNIMCLVVDMDEMLGKDLQTGLNNMKQMVESRSN